MVGLSPGQKEAYLQNIYNHSRTIQKFCNGDTQHDPETKNAINRLLMTAGRITTHLDLATDDQVNWEKEEVGYALLHPKFQFLKSFLDAIRYQLITIALMAEAGKTLVGYHCLNESVHRLTCHRIYSSSF